MNYEQLILSYMNNLAKNLSSKPLVLGGAGGGGGGYGGPVGGFVGYLPQTRVAYDTSESGILTGSGSLVDNLNHIRYRISGVENSSSVRRSLVTIVNNYSILDTDSVVVCNKGSSLTVTLPQASGTGKSYTVKNINSGIVTISAFGTIDDSSTADIYQWEAVTIVDYTTSGWIII